MKHDDTHPDASSHHGSPRGGRCRFLGAGAAMGARDRASDRWLDVLCARAFRPDHPLCGDLPTTLARWGLYLRGHYLRMPPRLLARHLARKAVMRSFRNTSRAM